MKNIFKKQIKSQLKKPAFVQKPFCLKPHL